MRPQVICNLRLKKKGGKVAYADLREYINRLEEEGELKRIKAEVDWNLEVGAIMRRANDLRQPALLFEKIRGYPPDYRIFANVVGAAKPNIYGRVSLALGLPEKTPPLEIIEEMVRRFGKLAKPVLVAVSYTHLTLPTN